MKFEAFCEGVTAKILDVIEREGKLPWVKPWASAGIEWPTNPTTSKKYHGANAFFFNMAAIGYQSNLWATFNQWKDAGGTVRKGEKGTPALRPIEIRRASQDAAQGQDEAEKLLLFTPFYAFNLDQVDGVDHLRPEPVVLKPVERDERIEAAITATGAKILPHASQCFFRPSTDEIHMVEAGAFDSIEHFYATEFHELGHWTGHETRLNRDLKNAFKSHAYAAEELIAELNSAFMCQHFGIDGMDRHQGAYLQGWASLFREDKKAILKAAGPAAKAFKFLVPEVSP